MVGKRPGDSWAGPGRSQYIVGIYPRETGRGPDKGWGCIGWKSNNIYDQGVITKTARESGPGQ